MTPGTPHGGLEKPCSERLRAAEPRIIRAANIDGRAALSRPRPDIGGVISNAFSEYRAGEVYRP
jgi:hypothetical protein